MRPEITIIILTSIFVYTLKSLLEDHTESENSRIYLDSVNGFVDWGNFSYWKLSHNGPLVIVLETLSGDADLYIGDIEKPSYEVESHNFSSVTCGLDQIYIPSDFPRPMGVAVYGHKAHEVSEFVISVYLDLKGLENANTMPMYAETTDDSTTASDNQHTISHDGKGKSDNSRKSTRYIGLLSILDMLFEILVV